MTVSVDVWLRGTDFAQTATFDDITHEPADWTDDDVRQLLGGMLRAMYRLHKPGEPDGYISLKALSWIVNPFEGGGIVVAIEITLGAVIAGPFHMHKATLEEMITRVMLPSGSPPSTLVH